MTRAGLILQMVAEADCLKRRFNTREEANSCLNSMMKNGKETDIRMNVYRCSECPYWHMGHVMAVRTNANKPSSKERQKQWRRIQRDWETNEADFDADDTSLLQRRINKLGGHRLEVGHYVVWIRPDNRTFTVRGTKFGEPDALLYSGYWSYDGRIRWDQSKMHGISDVGPENVEKAVLSWFKEHGEA